MYNHLQIHNARPTLDERQLATLYAEFADEDRSLAEEGVAGYGKGLMEMNANWMELRDDRTTHTS